ncbi:uncharacterized protein VTP21DRAFT_199 [Calcarisporiella thermophila]|uniref:uncharacterized protein n=1 Tax=Calcarisporiella thermophila TaxID=911321 RepID=UPI00374459EC
MIHSSKKVGLSRIFPDGEIPSTTDERLIKAKWFYFSKFVQSFDYDAYLKWKSSEKSEQPTEGVKMTGAKSKEKDDEPHYPLSFHQICDMIARGEEIPGIRQIPNKLHEGTPSKPSLQPRPKPWEKKQ